MRVGFFPADNENQRWGRDIHPWSRLATDALIEAGCKVTCLSRDGLKNISARSELDIIHLNWPQALMQARSARLRRPVWKRFYAQWFVARCKLTMRRLRQAKIPVVWQVHDLPYAADPVDRDLMTFLFRQFYSLADGLLFYEESAKEPFYEVFGSSRDKIVGRAPLGDYTRLHGPIKSKEAARKSSGFESPGKIFFYPGTVRWTRSPASFIHAFASRAGQSDVLVVSGRGTNAFSDLAIADRVIVKPGMIEHDEFRDLICASDFVVNDAPQYLGSAIIRAAMGYGVPVVARRFGCTQDMANGACVDIPDGPEGIGQAIDAALALTQDQYQRMSYRAFENHRARPWSGYAAGCVSIYDQVICSARNL